MDERAQQLPTERYALRGTAIDLTGQTFGQLTAVRPVSSTAHGVRWLCQCDCGQFAERTAWALRRAVSCGHVPQCAQCQAEARRGGCLAGRALWHAVYVEWLQAGRPLYAERQLDKMREGIERDLDQLGFPRGQPPPDLTDGAANVPPDPVFQKPTDEDEQTYREIGEELGVTRERVRQIEQIALHRLSKNVELRRLADLPYPAPRQRPPEFRGCRCARYASALPGSIYCQACGQVWALDPFQVQRVLTAALLARVTVTP